MVVGCGWTRVRLSSRMREGGLYPWPVLRVGARRSSDRAPPQGCIRFVCERVPRIPLAGIWLEPFVVGTDLASLLEAFLSALCSPLCQTGCRAAEFPSSSSGLFLSFWGAGSRLPRQSYHYHQSHTSAHLHPSPPISTHLRLARVRVLAARHHDNHRDSRSPRTLQALSRTMTKAQYCRS